VVIFKFPSNEGKNKEKKLTRNIKKKDNGLFQSVMLTNPYCPDPSPIYPPRKAKPSICKGDLQESFTFFVLLYELSALETYGVMQLLCHCITEKS